MSLAITPFITVADALQVVYLLAGMNVALLDTGNQIILRAIHGADAGPWLGAQPLSFGTFSLLVPLSDYLSPNVIYIYLISAALCIIMAVVILTLYWIDKPPPLSAVGGRGLDSLGHIDTTKKVEEGREEKPSDLDASSAAAAGLVDYSHLRPQRYVVEILMGLICFCVVGVLDGGKSHCVHLSLLQV